MRIRSSVFINRQNIIHNTVRLIIVLAVVSMAIGTVRLTLNTSSPTPAAKPFNSSAPNDLKGSLSWVSDFNWKSSNDYNSGRRVPTTNKRLFSEDGSSAAKKKLDEKVNDPQELVSELNLNRASGDYLTRSRLSFSQDGNPDASRVTQKSSRNVQVPADLKPTESHLRKAHSFDGDLRDLPYVPPVKRERPEREPPRTVPAPYPFATSPSPTAQTPSSQLAI